MEQNAHWSIAILQNQSAAFWTLKVFQGSSGVCRRDWCSELLLLCVSVEPVWNRLTNFFRGTMCVGKMFIYKVMWYSHCFSVDSRQDSQLAANHMWLKTYINIKCHELCGNKWCLSFFCQVMSTTNAKSRLLCLNGSQLFFKSSVYLLPKTARAL